MKHGNNDHSMGDISHHYCTLGERGREREWERERVGAGED